MCRNARGGCRRRGARTGLFACLGLAFGTLSLTTPAQAQAIGADGDRTYVYSRSGVTLPTNTPSDGQDEVQASGEISCRSSVGGGGPYVDAGVVGSEDRFGRATTSAYARVVVPLGRRPRRIDCTELYELEIERLRMELALAHMNMQGVTEAPLQRANQVPTMPFRNAMASE